MLRMPSMRSGSYSGLALGALMLAGACVCLHADLERVDVRVQSIRVQPGRPSADQPISVYALLRNAGSAQAGNIYITVEIRRGEEVVRKISDIPVLSELPRSGIGLSVPLSVGQLPEGDYRIRVWVTPSEDEGENRGASVHLHVFEKSKSSSTVYGSY